MVLICQVVVKEVSFEWSHYRISLNLNQPVQYYINYIPGGGGTVPTLHYGLYRGGGGGHPKGVPFFTSRGGKGGNFSG